MVRAVACSLVACALWALTFVAPVLVEAGAGALTFGRYLVFGLSSLVVLAALGFNPFRRLGRRDWGRVIALGLTGNTLCYLLMAGGVVAAGPATVAVIFASLPLTMVVVGNLRRPVLAWRGLAGPIALIVAGVTVAAVSAGSEGDTGSLPALGVVLALLALGSWLVYGVWNAEYLADRPGTNMVLWASLIGLGTLITLPAVAAVELLINGPPAWGAPDPALVAWALVLGLGASWVATWLWNIASAGVETALLGMLMVSEALFALLYTCLIERRPPLAGEVLAAALAVAGVVWGLLQARAAAARRGVASERVALTEV